MKSSRAVPSSLPAVAAACARCRNCSLHEHATQAVFGEGPNRAALMLVGEQPGDQEDLEGRPFVGPAGGMLDAALAEAGLERSQVYLTNAVKHFSFTERGKRRLHKKPTTREVMACKPWLTQEMGIIRPLLVVSLGATAAYALHGARIRLTRDRGRILVTPWPELGDASPHGLVTFHPAAILRAPDAERRRQLREMFIADLALARRELQKWTRRAADSTRARGQQGTLP